MTSMALNPHFQPHLGKWGEKGRKGMKQLSPTSGKGETGGGGKKEELSPGEFFAAVQAHSCCPYIQQHYYSLPPSSVLPPSKC